MYTFLMGIGSHGALINIMKNRFAHFLVKKSRIIMILFILFALGCAALIPFVNINYDMREYLPEDSSMRHGLDIMETEFGTEESSSLEVMFRDLRSSKQKAQTLRQLEQIPHVHSVEYALPGNDENGTYNRNGYTRYILNCDCDQYADEAAAVWTAVRDRFGENHEIELGGPVNDANETGLPLWIIAAAVSLVVLILLIMANAWIEPVVFLITIGIAVLINMGTYVLFPSISNTTFSIVALLQLVLSMDYSIMLLNRYRQQRQVIADKHEAIRRALSLSFGAITGSSFTTFAGLLALLFMSFTMGADVGLALAKGVLISLLCIFTVLPALLTGFDALMLKTAKRTLPFDLPKLSKLQFKGRIPLSLLFAALFLFVFIARGGVDFTYSQGRDSQIDDVFGHTNTIVMIYDEEDGEAAGALADALEDRPNIRSVVCYESTLGKQRTASGMKTFIEDMRDSDTGNGDMDLSTSMLRLLYYDYYDGNPSFRLTISEFVNYLRGDVMNDPDFGSSIDSDMRRNIEDMAKFTDQKTLTAPMGAHALADFFGLKTSQVKQLLLYDRIEKGSASGGKMTVPGFIRFLLNDVANDPDYGRMADASAKKDLQAIQDYTNQKTMTTPVSFEQAAPILGMDDPQMRLVYVYHLVETEASTLDSGTMSIPELADTLQRMADDPALQAQFDGSDTEQLIDALQQIGPENPTPYSIAVMPDILAEYGIAMDRAVLTLICAYRDISADPSSHRVSIQNIIRFMLNSTTVSSALPKEQKAQLQMLQKIIDNSVSGQMLSADAMADLLNRDRSEVRTLYLLHQYKSGDTCSWKNDAAAVRKLPHGHGYERCLDEKEDRQPRGGIECLSQTDQQRCSGEEIHLQRPRRLF